ncbi:MAG: hypothetical protein ABSE73_16780 [Planctomycetota bacterium]
MAASGACWIAAGLGGAEARAACTGGGVNFGVLAKQFAELARGYAKLPHHDPSSAQGR